MEDEPRLGGAGDDLEHPVLDALGALVDVLGAVPEVGVDEPPDLRAVPICRASRVDTNPSVSCRRIPRRHASQPHRSVPGAERLPVEREAVVDVEPHHSGSRSLEVGEESGVDVADGRPQRGHEASWRARVRRVSSHSAT
jgi:hypothetical protein